MTACWVRPEPGELPATRPTRAWASASTAAAPATLSERQALGLPRHDVAQSANHGAHRGQDPARLDQGRNARCPTKTFSDPELITAENFASDYKAKLCK